MRAGVEDGGHCPAERIGPGAGRISEKCKTLKSLSGMGRMPLRGGHDTERIVCATLQKSGLHWSRRPFALFGVAPPGATQDV